MKNSVFRAIALLLLVSLPVLSGCSKREIFTRIMDHERSNAKLVVKTRNLGFGKIVYLENTSGKGGIPVVMLHGFGGDKDNWDRFSKKLTDHCRLIIPDLPGHGESVQDLSLNYGIQEQAKRLKEFLDSLGIKKAHLVGNSMGGAIAMRYAALYPESVQSLALIDTAGAVRAPSEFDAIVKRTGRNPVLDIKSAAVFKNMMKYIYEKPPYLPGFVIDVLTEEKLKRRAIEQKIYRDILADMDQTSIVANIHAPTLIIWGARDRIINVDSAEWLHQKIAGSKKEILEGVGHCPMIEKPEVTGELYLRFLHEIGA